MADADKRQVDTLTKLFEALKANHLEADEIMAEVDRVLGGKLSRAEELKEAEKHFDLCWTGRYARSPQEHYVWNFARDRPNMKRLLKNLSMDELKDRMTNYLHSSDPFYQRSKHPFGIFVSSINSHTNSMPKSDRDEAVQCRHEPTCDHRVKCRQRKALNWPETATEYVEL